MTPRRIDASLRIAKRVLFPPTIHRCPGSSHTRHSASVLRTRTTVVAGGVMGLGLFVHASTPSACAGAAPSGGSRRRRPPTFGASIPKITTRGVATNKSTDAALADIEDRADCPLCKKFGAGPCGEIFQRWLACTDQHPGKDIGGDPLHLIHCSDSAEELAACLEAHTEHYAKSENDKDGALKDGWTEFVKEMEDGIAAGKYDLLPYPEKLEPKTEVRLASRTGATFFVPEKDGDRIVAAYILDEHRNVIAAGSKDDMDMGSHGCVLQFKVATGMTSATSCAIYDNANDDVLIFSRKNVLPVDQGK